MFPRLSSARSNINVWYSDESILIAMRQQRRDFWLDKMMRGIRRATFCKRFVWENLCIYLELEWEEQLHMRLGRFITIFTDRSKRASHKSFRIIEYARVLRPRRCANPSISGPQRVT
jgi:hypothetical protein